MKLAHVIFKRSVRTLQKTHCFSITDISLLMILMVMVSVGFGIYIKYINPLKPTGHVMHHQLFNIQQL